MVEKKMNDVSQQRSESLYYISRFYFVENQLDVFVPAFLLGFITSKAM